MAINLATKYSTKIDKAFTLNRLTNGGAKAKYDFTGAKTVKVYSIDNMEMNNYSRTGSNRFGTPENIGDKVQELIVNKDRSFTGIIDKANNTQQLQIKKAGEMLKQQIDEVINPELDAYALNVWTNTAVANKKVFATTLTKENIYEYFLKAQASLTNAKVPTSGRIAYVTPTAHNLLKRSNGEFVKYGDISQKMLIEGQVGKIDNVAIIEVPEIYMPANAEIVLIHPNCSTMPVQLETYRVLDNVQGIDGSVVEGHIVYDCFVLDKKKDAIAVVANGTTGMNAVSKAGSTTNGTFLSYEIPGVTGLTVKYKLDSSAITLPAIGGTVASYTAYSASEIAASTNTHYMLVALDSNNKVVFAEGGELVKA